MTIPLRRIGGLAAASVAALSLLGACTPPDKAVGDTQEKEPDVAFDGLDRGDVVIGFIGSDRPDFDRVALQALEDSGLAASYLSVAEVEDPARAAQQGVKDMAERQVAIIVVSRLDIADDTADGWDEALDDARGAGIPVALLNPLSDLPDDTLYAAALTVNDRAADATPIGDAVMTIIDDLPHDKDMMVGTLTDE